MADLPSAVRPVGVGGLYALCETTIRRISHVSIRTLASRYPAIAEAFWRDCMLDAAVLMQWAVNNGRRNARSRIAHLLCEMAIRHGQDGQPLLRYVFPVTQELGEATALTGVHVNRSFRTLDDIVSVNASSVNILDWVALVNVAEFDPTYLLADTGDNRQGRLISAL